MRTDGIRKFGEQFRGRLEGWMLDDALSYIDHCEAVLCLEILCDHLSDYDVPISSEEHEEALRLGREWGLDLSSARFTYLHNLISTPGGGL